MKRWRVLINGTNFKMPFELPESRRQGLYRALSADKHTDTPEVKRMGFYTTVFVAARSPEQAELRAVDVLRRDKSLGLVVRNAKSDPPRVFADEIHEISSFRGCRRPRTGFVFYAERGPKRKKR